MFGVVLPTGFRRALSALASVAVVVSDSARVESGLKKYQVYPAPGGDCRFRTTVPVTGDGPFQKERPQMSAIPKSVIRNGAKPIGDILTVPTCRQNARGNPISKPSGE